VHGFAQSSGGGAVGIKGEGKREEECHSR